MVEDLDQRIWALLSRRLCEPEEIRQVARLLYDQFIPRVMGVLKKLGVDEITSEGIAKEAVQKAVNAYHPGRAKFLTFVSRIALNIRVDKYRQGSLPRQTVEPLDEHTLSLQEGFDDPLAVIDPAEESDFVNRVRSIFPLLSQEDRILIQFDVQGVPKESYMEIFGIGKAAYRQRKSRAYARLRDLYESEYP